jgi:chromosome partitioning protein
MQKDNKMKTVAFSAIKGGVGKSSICILTANYLASTGARVLLIDLDIQNSLTFYYSPDEHEKKNIAQALIDQDLSGNVVEVGDNISLIPSSLNLVQLRSLNTKTLKRSIAAIESDFDFCLIDCPPALDNIVLNAVNASDLIISPVRFSQFDWKSAVFFSEQIERETGKLSNWRLLFNFYRQPRTNNPDAEINQYLELFTLDFGDAVLNTRIPETGFVKKAIDTKTIISKAKTKEKLYKAIESLCFEIVGDGMNETRGF